ncbi:MAG: saccharopine dehydrogenase NADP-binding domain-containing protein [Candidatus Dormibacteraeota bacterium]|uniref:Saccharopine dehydrogenase n=1 Tax=Candidatus Aeolococcus gillhamiae TaxID=3127015 RepID=A0A2W6AA79_9BACT|nr:saccharopine dehydrogenase NADP-binding domain-containing protein [Candidatus Dormibacteraeota bacterium]PZR82228.1 MAG: saccharopine dehydrogenase [Candidatus Dormibacter sp. RRmetagenome_bin12]
MAGRIVVFGATGYTGTLAAEELAAAGIPAVLAGRDRGRLEQLASRLRGTFDIATADVGEPASVAALVGPGDVLVSTVGPFARWGDPAVNAAIERGAGYIDSTGEPQFVRRVFEDFGPRAERKGVVLLTAFGYDCVPGNVAAALALEDAGAKAVQVDVGYFVTRGRPSGGTLASLLGVTRAPSFAWRDGALRTERGGAHIASFDLGDHRADALSFGGSEHLGLPRSYPRLRTIGTYVGWFGPLTKGVKVLGAAQTELERLPGASTLIDRATHRFARGSTGGPDAAARGRMTSRVVAVARDARGKELATARLEGVDAYTLTARLLVWGAMQLRDGAAAAAGARGPVEAFGLDTMAHALADTGLPRAA